MEDKNYVIISIKKKHLTMFMIETLNKLGIERMSINLIKAINDKHAVKNI